MSALGFIRKTFALDFRSMALYRVLIGLVVMCDVIYRLEDLTDFYTDIGLVPRSLFISEMAMPWSFSFHLANGSLVFAIIMFTIHFLCGLFMSVGYKTKFFSLMAFVFTVSVHNRNWLVNNGGDDVLRSILFISIFLPLGKFYSVDAAMRKEPLAMDKKEHFSFWTLTFFLQVFCIYFISYILKDHPIWRSDFTAVFFSSKLDIFVAQVGLWIRNFPFLMKVSTFFTIYLEWLGPLLLIGSFAFRKYWWVVRTALVLLFIGFHFGIFLTMNIGLFTFICMAMWTIFLPGPLWDKIGDALRKRGFGKMKIYFDADCGFCQKGVRIIRSFFLLPEVEIATAQSVPKIGAQMKGDHSWVVVNGKGESFTQYNAWIEITNNSPVLYPVRKVFSFAPVRFLGQKIYKFVSHNRGLFGKLTQWLEYTGNKKDVFSFKLLREIMGVVFFATLLMWNLTTIRKYNIKSPVFQSIGRWLHIYQEWNMFAPYPKLDNVWVEVPGVLSDGSEVEVITGNRDTYSIKDQAFYDSIPNEHWRKFYLNLTEKNTYSRYFGSFLCRKWNDRNIRWVENTTLRKFEVVVYSQVNLPDGEKSGITKKHSWKHWCFDEEYKKEAPNK